MVNPAIGLLSIGIMMSSVCNAVYCGIQGRCKGLKVVPSYKNKSCYLHP